MTEQITIAELIEGSGNPDKRTLLASVVLSAMGARMCANGCSLSR